MNSTLSPYPRPAISHFWLAILIAGLSYSQGCTAPTEPPPTLEALQAGDQLKQSGRRLIHIPTGVHRLTSKNHRSDKVVLAVHGYKSRGYEWVTSLHQFAKSKAHVYWLRWDWNQCPASGLKDLQKAIRQIQTENPNIRSMEIFGHSYGGIISTMFAQAGPATLPIQVHAIASPLAGMGKLKALCKETGIDGKSAQANITLTQWRTQHQLDGAFKDEPTDPQVVKLPGAEIVQLPDTFHGKRLGHNWSVAYVAEQWLAQEPSSSSATSPRVQPQE